MNEPTKGGLARKLALISREIGKVPKTGHNAFHKYDYVTENDLVYAVRDKLAEANIFVFTSTETQHCETILSGGGEKSTLLTTVCTKHTFVDGDTGEEFSVLSQGQGSDNGDKGGYKAITGAMKYFIYKCFMIPTGDDPEGDTRTDERGAGGAAAPSRAQEPAKSTASPARSTPSVLRDAGVDEVAALRGQFEGGKWETVVVHFGKDKGTALARMDEKKLTWWIENYKPEPFNGRIDPANLKLRAALDVADIEWK